MNKQVFERRRSECTWRY